MRNPSGFDLKTDKDQEPEGIALLLIAGVLLVAVVTGGIELASAAGLPVPHAVTMFLGLTIGAAFGFGLRRVLQETDDHG